MYVLCFPLLLCACACLFGIVAGAVAVGCPLGMAIMDGDRRRELLGSVGAGLPAYLDLTPVVLAFQAFTVTNGRGTARRPTQNEMENACFLILSSHACLVM